MPELASDPRLELRSPISLRGFPEIAYDAHIASSDAVHPPRKLPTMPDNEADPILADDYQMHQWVAITITPVSITREGDVEFDTSSPVADLSPKVNCAICWVQMSPDSLEAGCSADALVPDDISGLTTP